MAKQMGYGMIVGTIGDLTFYERDGDYYVRRKSDVGARRVKEAPEFQRTRELNEEFRGATRHGHGIRTALRGLVYGIMEKSNSGILASKIFKSVLSNPVGERGKRKLNPVTLAGFLEGHEFNTRSTLPVNFGLYDEGGLTVNLDRVSGVATVTFASHDSIADIEAPGLADTYNFVAGVAWWDGTENDIQGSVRCGWRGDWITSMEYDVMSGMVSEQVLRPQFPAGFTGLLIVVAGIRYWKEDRTAEGFWLRRQSCLRVVKVDAAP